MIVFRRIGLYATLPLLVLLLGCPGQMEPESRQDFELSRELPQRDGPWTDQPTKQAQVKVGPDSALVTVRWTPAHQGQHRRISRISVVFPPRPKSQTFSAGLAGIRNVGSAPAFHELRTLLITWTRDTALRDGGTVTTLELKGDGTFVVRN